MLLALAEGVTQLLPRLDSHRERAMLCPWFYVSGAWFPWQKPLIPRRSDRQSRGAGCLERLEHAHFLSHAGLSLFIIANCKLFQFCDFSVDACGTAFPVSSRSPSVSMPCKMPLPFLAILANRSLCGLRNMFRTVGKWGEVAWEALLCFLTQISCSTSYA